MATLKDYRDERLKKLSELRALGINPYPAKSYRTHKLKEVSENFETLEGEQATVLGRIVSIRKFGKLAFIVLKDDSGKLQLFLRAGDTDLLNVEEGTVGIEQISLLDTGDYLEATGEIIRTKTGEISLAVKKMKLLAKALRPTPENLADKEERLRRRYLDTKINQNVYERYQRRSKFWQATRDFLNQNDFLEVNIPVLEHTTGGADANPFVTHMDALDQDFYLRISQELPLKRLIGGGYEKVYEIGPRFRNENYTDEHLPEHVALEWYWAYADWEKGMSFMEKMYQYVIQETFGTLKFQFNNQEVNLSGEWPKLDYNTIIKERYNIDVYESSLEEVKEALKNNNLEVEQTENRSRGIDKLWKNIRKDIAGPIWLINTPKFISPLAKTSPTYPLGISIAIPVVIIQDLPGRITVASQANRS